MLKLGVFFCKKRGRFVGCVLENTQTAQELLVVALGHRLLLNSSILIDGVKNSSHCETFGDNLGILHNTGTGYWLMHVRPGKMGYGDTSGFSQMWHQQIPRSFCRELGSRTAVQDASSPLVLGR